MTSMSWRTVVATLLLMATALGMAQTTEEEDMNFAIGTFGLRMQQIARGDYSDRSGEFPKNAYGEILKGMYGIARRTTLRSLDADAQLSRTQIMVVAGLEWTHSPKAALRELAKATRIFSQAKVAQQKDLKVGESLFQAGDQDTDSMRLFKTGLRSGFETRLKAGEGKDYYTAFLILLSTLEDLYQHLDTHRKQLSVLGAGLVYFEDPQLDLAYEQKVVAVEKAALSVQKVVAEQNRRFIDGIRQMKGLAPTVSIR